MSETGWVLAIVGPIIALITGVLTWWSKSGVDAWKKMRQQRQEERVYEDEQEVSSYKVLTQQLTSDLHDVRSALVEVQARELECVRRTGVLEGKCSALETINAEHEKRFEKQDKEIDELRKWRHELANDAHTAVLKTKVQQMRDSGEFELNDLQGPKT